MVSRAFFLRGGRGGCPFPLFAIVRGLRGARSLVCVARWCVCRNSPFTPTTALRGNNHLRPIPTAGMRGSFGMGCKKDSLGVLMRPIADDKTTVRIDPTQHPFPSMDRLHRRLKWFQALGPLLFLHHDPMPSAHVSTLSRTKKKVLTISRLDG